MGANEELLRKAVVTTTDIAAAGKLNDQQANQFIDYVFDLTGLKNKVRTVRFRNDKMEINKLGVFKRSAVPAIEATDPGVRRGITTSKILLEPKEIMSTFEIGDDFLRENIEGMSVEEKVVRFMATQFTNDMEELFILGDTNGVGQIEGDILEGGSSTLYVRDTFLQLMDGWLRRLDGANLHDANLGTDILAAMHAMILKMPVKYRRNRADMAWMLSMDTEQKFLYSLQNRNTALGDQAVAGGNGAIRPLGIPMMSFPLWPANARVSETIQLNGTTPVTLRHKGATNIVVLDSALADIPTAKFVLTTDYVLGGTGGAVTVASSGTGAISSGDYVLVCYDAPQQMVLTHPQNLIVGMGLDITLERDRSIFRRVNQFALTAKVATQVENLEAAVKGYNLNA